MYKLALASALCAGSVLAQAPPPSPTPPPGPKMTVSLDGGNFTEFGPIGITAALAGPTTNIANAPYSADVETSRVQNLVDGNRIEHHTTGSVARDSQGRLRREESLPALEGNGSAAPHLTFIDDPVAGVHWTLDPRTKTASKMPIGPPPGMQGPGKGARLVQPALPYPPGHDKVFFFSSQHLTTVTTDGSDSQTVKTDLGTQTIEGVPAQGTRITRTIPAGKMGNSMPLVITTETWFSPDLKVLVMSKVSDPRMGDTTYKLTNIQRVDPPPSLFTVPSDYTVQEGGRNFFIRTDKKP